MTVSISVFLSNLITLVNQYVYTKAQTKSNFDSYVDNHVHYIDGRFGITDWDSEWG